MRLDDLYKMTCYIYQDANMTRSREATYLHFVEICSLLTQAERKKKKVTVDIPSAICKALGWYFPLLGRMGVASVEQLVFLKFPYACPYCRETPHQDEKCKLVKGSDATVSHEEVKRLFEANYSLLPMDLNNWMKMFREIYPRTLNAPTGFSTIALFEELGELAEAIRVFDRHPHYFYGEAADVFSYIMGIANEYRISLDEPDAFDLQKEFLTRYPGLCVNCGSRSCICPALPKATVGRMAKELRIDVKTYQIGSFSEFSSEGLDAANEVFKNSGFNPEIARRLPYDRGELNAALTLLAFRVANAMSETNPEASKQLREKVLAIAHAEPGSSAKPDSSPDVIVLLRDGWNSLDEGVQASIRGASAQGNDLTHLLEKRVLFIAANPDQESKKALALDKEFRAIKEAFARKNVPVHIEPLLAASVDDVRRALMEEQFDFIHFSGHADQDGIALIGETGSEVTLSYDVLSKMIKSQHNLESVLLNGCHTGEGAEQIPSPLIVGILDEIDDEAALAFSAGFYEAVAAQHSADSAFEQGAIAVASKQLSPHAIVKFRGKK